MSLTPIKHKLKIINNPAKAITNNSLNFFKQSTVKIAKDNLTKFKENEDKLNISDVDSKVLKKYDSKFTKLNLMRVNTKPIKENDIGYVETDQDNEIDLNDTSILNNDTLAKFKQSNKYLLNEKLTPENKNDKSRIFTLKNSTKKTTENEKGVKVGLKMKEDNHSFNKEKEHNINKQEDEVRPSPKKFKIKVKNSRNNQMKMDSSFYFDAVRTYNPHLDGDKKDLHISYDMPQTKERSGSMSKNKMCSSAISFEICNDRTNEAGNKTSSPEKAYRRLETQVVKKINSISTNTNEPNSLKNINSLKENLTNKGVENESNTQLLFNKKSIFNNTNNILVDNDNSFFQSKSDVSVVHNKTSDYEDIEDIHFEFVRFIKKSKSIVKFQEIKGACKISGDYNSVIMLDDELDIDDYII